MGERKPYSIHDLYKYASDEAMRAGGDDPRLAAQGAEMAYRHSSVGRAEVLAKAAPIRVGMVRGESYGMR